MIPKPPPHPKTLLFDRPRRSKRGVLGGKFGIISNFYFFCSERHPQYQRVITPATNGWCGRTTKFWALGGADGAVFPRGLRPPGPPIWACWGRPRGGTDDPFGLIFQFLKKKIKNIFFYKTQSNDLFISSKRKIAILKMSLKSSLMSTRSQEFELK